MIIRRRKIWWAIIPLALIHVVAICAGFFAPYDFASQNRELPFASPSKVHFFDRNGNWHARPFIYGLVERPGSFGIYDEDYNRVYPLKFFVEGEPYRILGLISLRAHLFNAAGPEKI